MNKVLVSLSLMVFLSSCSSQIDYRSAAKPPQTVASVDLEKYSGKWFEIARYPNSFQKNCESVTAEYGVRDDNKISVVNTCHAEEKRSATGVARVVSGSNNSKLKVKFAPAWVPFAEGDYWVLHIEGDYQAALVGDPEGKYLWILARAPQIKTSTLNVIKARAEELGYDSRPLKMTVHK